MASVSAISSILTSPIFFDPSKSDDPNSNLSSLGSWTVFVPIAISSGSCRNRLVGLGINKDPKDCLSQTGFTFPFKPVASFLCTSYQLEQMIPMHPLQKNQMPFGSYRYPSMESDPSYMMMDPAKCMPLHDSGRNCWPYGYPMPSYSCCNGGNFFPGYYNFRPPHLPVPPHQHMHFYGGYPPYPEPYMPNMFPPHYNVEQPRCEFDKNMMRNHHCCGCPNSLCGRNQKEDRCLKIEEEKPDNQRLGSLVPFQLGNNQSPIVWIPPDYVESKNERQPSEIATVKQDKECHGLNSTENLKAVEKAPKFWNGWPMSDMSRLGSWLPDAEGMGTRKEPNKQQEDGKKEFPFPVIWMPPFGSPEGARKSVHNMDTEQPSNVGKLVPTNILQKDDATSEGPEVVKTINQSNIPEMDVNHKTEHANKKKEGRCIEVETVEDNKERASSKNDIKRQSSTSPKKSRLPPVCLRVDPLPKKKNANGSSRSQSPPKSTAVKESSQLDSKINSAIVEPNSEKIIKEVEVKSHENLDGTQGENIYRLGEPLSSPTPPQEKVFDKLCKEEIASEEHGNKDGTISQVSTRDLVREEGKNGKPDLSDVEAALLIQSAYRGYAVRKWELLKKMKQLAEARQQVIEVLNRVKALELAPQDEKEKVFVGEMIMRLLLKLDAIQGLHPFAREFRKSLAKELVALQEKLDCMDMVTKATEVELETSMEKHVKEEEQNKDDVVVVNNSAGGIDDVTEGENERNSLSGESDGARRLCKVDDVAGSEGMMSSTDKELQKPSGDGYSEVPEGNGENTKVEAEQFAEVTEPEVQNEDTSELSSHDFSKHLGSVVMTSLMEDKRPEQVASEHVELVTDAEQKAGEVQTGKQEDVRCAEDALEGVSGEQVREQVELATPQVLDKITISAPDENGQIEDQLAADMDLPMRENNNSHNSVAEKLEHIDMRGDVSEAEENAHDLEIELYSDRTLDEKPLEGQEELHAASVFSEQNGECSSYTRSENENGGASEESAELSVDQSNSNDDLNIQNELETERNEQQAEEVLEDVQHQPMPSSELHNQSRRACDKSAELLEELSKPHHKENIENETLTAKDEQGSARDGSKTEEVILQEPCVVDPMSSSRKLETEVSKLYVAEEATPAVMSEEPLPALPNASRETTDEHDLGTEKAIDKKLIEENEKMREMVEKLMEAGKEQIAIISKLSRRVKDLEERLVRKKKLRRGCGLPTPRYPMLNGRTKA